MGHSAPELKTQTSIYFMYTKDEYISSLIKIFSFSLSSMFENEKVLPVDRHHVLIHLVLVTSFSSSPLFLFLVI